MDQRFNHDNKVNRPIILTVDDDKAILDMIVCILEDEFGGNDYEIACARGGKEALDFVHQQQPFLILLDLNMPGIDGIDVIKALREDKNTASIPIILVSADLGIKKIQREWNIADSLPKPFDTEELISCIYRYLPSWESFREIEPTRVHYS